MTGSGRQASTTKTHPEKNWETNEKKWETNERKWETSQPDKHPAWETNEKKWETN